MLVNCFGSVLDHESTILDIGSGLGHVGSALVRRGHVVFGLDQQVFTTCPLESVIGRAQALPFADSCIDYSMLGFVLHHLPAHHHIEVLREALRVSSKGVLLLEDVYRGRFERLRTFVLDRLFNLEIGSHPHSNRTTDDWLELLSTVNCSTRVIKEDVICYGGLPMRQLFILARKRA